MVKSKARFRIKLISIAVASCFATSAALANPRGGVTTHGTPATITNPAANVLNVQTYSAQTIINWGSFSISVGELTRFMQPSAASAVLNRIAAGASPSSILGSLESNGRVFLINPNGIAFGAGSQINVAGLVASTLNLTDADFLAGRMRFGDGLGKTLANEGNITTPSGGSVYLVGSAVTNKDKGIITSPQGEVILAAGNSVELVNPGTPNLRVEIAATDNQAINLGQILSDAGRVGIYAGLINNSGTIRADSAVSEGGRILLKATKSVALESSSVLSAQGQGGGEIKVLAGDNVQVAGRLDASAPNGGDGGFVETSAAKVHVASGTIVTTSAPYGKTGTWLIDPNDYTIAFTNGDITGAQLGTNLGTTSVVITSDQGATSGNGDIFVFDSISWTAPNSLTLLAKRNIEINGSSINGGGDLNFFAGWDGGSTSSPTVTGGVGDISSIFNSVSTIRGNVFFEAGRDINLVSSTVSAGDGTFFGDRTAQLIAGGSINISAPDGNAGVFANAASGGGFATVILHAKNGSISIDRSEVTAKGGGGSEGAGGGAKVTLCTGSLASDVCTPSSMGGISITDSAVQALGGSGNSNQAGGSVMVSLTAGGGGIQVWGSFVPIGTQIARTIYAQGGSASDGGAGGSATIALSTTGGITVGDAEFGGSKIEAFAGRGGNGRQGSGNGNGGDGGAATITLTGGSISLVSGSIIDATGGAGGSGGNSGAAGGNGGAAKVTLTGSSISLDGVSSINANGGDGGSGGFAFEGGTGGRGGNGGTATVALTGSSVSMTGSIISVNGGQGGDGGSASFGGGGQGGNGGAAMVTLSGSSISLEAASSIDVGGGDGGDGGQGIEGAAGGLGGNGGNAAVTLAGGSVSLTGSFISVSGGDGNDGGDASSGGRGGNGGSATVTITGTSISIESSSSINASGGDGDDGGNASIGGIGGNGGNGGSAMVSLTGGSISLSSSNIQAFGGSGGRGGNVTGTSGGIGGNGGNGANASVMLTAGTISVSSATINANGGSNGSGGFGSSANGVAGAGGAASVIVAANAGNLTVQGFSTIRADGAEGGTSVINLVAPGDITVTSSTIQAGDTCCTPGTNGGTSTIELTAGGNITVDGGEGGLFANGGSGQMNGGVAAITLTANGGITVNQASVRAFGGSGSAGNGGDAVVKFTANGGSILIQNTPFSIEAFGGAGPITGGGAAITMVAASGIIIDGSTVNATAYPFNCDCNPPQNGGLGLVSLNANAGTVDLLNGSVVEASGGGGIVTSGSAQIKMTFTGRTTGGYFIDGVESLIVDDLLLPTAGFFVNGEPAILNTNLTVTYLGGGEPPVFNDILVATMNQQVDVLADQLKAGETGETDEKEKKKLALCN